MYNASGYIDLLVFLSPNASLWGFIFWLYFQHGHIVLLCWLCNVFTLFFQAHDRNRKRHKTPVLSLCTAQTGTAACYLAARARGGDGRKRGSRGWGMDEWRTGGGGGRAEGGGVDREWLSKCCFRNDSISKGRGRAWERTAEQMFLSWKWQCLARRKQECLMFVMSSADGKSHLSHHRAARK